MFLLKHFKDHKPRPSGLEILKYIGPGFLVTVGFIDPGNWAANIACGSEFGYSLLWIVTLSTVMLILLQHNAAHLGIVSGLCLSEAATIHFSKLISKGFLISGILATIATATAEILGAAIGLNMLFHIPLIIGSAICSVAVLTVVLSNSYKMIERYIIGFVSLIGLAFIYELFLTDIHWGEAVTGAFVPSIPKNSILIIMSVMGAVVMPHNIFLHSEIIQSRKFNQEGEGIIKKRLKFEFLDTLIAMVSGWVINCIIIIVASVFFTHNIVVTELQQAEATIRPLLGNAAATVFAIALIFAGFSAAVTAAMASGSIFSGMFGEPLDLKDNHSRVGVFITMIGAFIAICLIGDPFRGLILSQVALSIQLPFTIFALIMLTSSKKVMGDHRNTVLTKTLLWCIAFVMIGFNLALLYNSF